MRTLNVVAIAMRVAIEATSLSLTSGGLARYTSELSLALARCFPEDEFFLISDQAFPMPEAAPPNLKRGGGPRNGWSAAGGCGDWRASGQAARRPGSRARFRRTLSLAPSRRAYITRSLALDGSDAGIMQPTESDGALRCYWNWALRL